MADVDFSKLQMDASNHDRSDRAWRLWHLDLVCGSDGGGGHGLGLGEVAIVAEHLSGRAWGATARPPRKTAAAGGTWNAAKGGRFWAHALSRPMILEQTHAPFHLKVSRVLSLELLYFPAS